VSKFDGSGAAAGTDTASNFEVFAGTTGNDTFVFDGTSFVTFVGNGGSDTVDFSHFGSAIWANLAHGKYEVETRDQSFVNTGPKPFRDLADLNGIESLIGTNYNDDLTGDVANNVLSASGGDDIVRASGGSDTLDGGAGSDTLTYAGWSGHVSIDLSAGTVSKFDGSGAAAGTDTASNFEVFAGTTGNDTFVFGGTSFVTFAGNGGSDTVDFSHFGSAIQVDLQGGGYEAQTRDAPTIVGNADPLRALADLNGVANITGTAFDDVLIGDSHDNVFVGGGGWDIMNGGAGADTFVASAPGNGVIQIQDFDDCDTIALRAADYPGLASLDQISVSIGSGGLSQFQSGGSAAFAFDTSSGNLYFSPDGRPEDAQLVAVLDNATLTASQLRMI
jgi:Ca2+-binding RTX toxin-like protein